MIDFQRAIWIVDDESIITGPLRRLIRDTLKQNELTDQFKPKAANDPLQVLKSIQQDDIPPALIIADIMMPQMNGLDFLKRIKAISPQTPRMVLTGYADKENAIRALNELELFHYIEKPWDNEQFKQLVVNALTQYRQNRIEAMFRRYVPRELLEEYVDKSDKTLLTGKSLNATVMFLDIVEFTRLSEQMSATDLVQLLNHYLTEMVDVIHRHSGILDKFTGDGLMALFGVLRSTGSVTTDACNGVLAALEIVERVSKIDGVFLNGTKWSIRVRLGLHTGNVIAGNIGSMERVNYTAVSDTVNTASRIENAARHVIANEKSCVLISENTYNLVKDTLQTQLYFNVIEKVELRGKENKVTLYKVTSNT